MRYVAAYLMIGLPVLALRLAFFWAESLEDVDRTARKYMERVPAGRVADYGRQSIVVAWAVNCLFDILSWPVYALIMILSALAWIAGMIGMANEWWGDRRSR